MGFDLNTGYSGGPIWHYVDGVPNVVGVVSTRQAAASVDRNYDQLLDWIDGNDILLDDRVVQPGPYLVTIWQICWRDLGVQIRSRPEMDKTPLVAAPATI